MRKCASFFVPPCMFRGLVAWFYATLTTFVYNDDYECASLNLFSTDCRVKRQIFSHTKDDVREQVASR